MTKNYEEDTSLQTESTPQPSKPSHSSKSNPMILLLTSIVVSIIIAGLYTKWELSKERTNILKTMQTVQRQQNALQHESKEAMSTIDQQVKQQLDDAQQKLQTTLKEHAYQTQDWLLLKARYYLELATIHARWSYDNLATIEILKQADDILSTLHDDKLSPVRQAIAKEQTATAQIPMVDITGIVSALNAIQLAVDELEPERVVTAPIAEKTQTDNQNHSWKEHFQNSLQALSHLVVIRHQDNDLAPLLTPTYVRMMREMIRLNLQEAQLAVLDHNQAIYQLTLSQAKDNLRRAFNNKANALINQLIQLQGTSVIQEKPNLGESLDLLNQIIQHNNKPEGETAP